MAKKRRKSKKPKPVRRELIILPVRNMILFPGVALPLMIGRERSMQAVQVAVQEKQPIGLLLQKNGQDEVPGPNELYEVGTIAEILRFLPMTEDRHNAICQAHQRFRILEYTQVEPFLVAQVEVIPSDERNTRPIAARFRALRARANEVLALAPGAPEDLAQAVEAIDSPALLCDMVATFMDVSPKEKQELLETFDLQKRLDRMNHMLGDLSEVLKLSQKIRQDTKGELDKAQRDYILREQLRAIRRELGDEEDDSAGEISELRERLDALELPEKTAEVARRELKRLARMPEHSAEHPMLRTWCEVFIELPWNTTSEGSIDLGRARKVLDEDHYGLEKVKRRILEVLAVRKLNPTGQGSTLCLVGPPGVGKTSLGRSVARAMGREFVRTSLGGIHDEAEIRGHRRTYVGALPGSILNGIKKAGTRDPVFVLDEMDKLGAGMHGDPSAALLEVLDPAQNDTFEDSYLGVPFDLSRVFFIGTANVLHAIPGALRDRLEVIELPGYTEQEKLEIAKRYLVKRRLAACGVKASQCRISVAALKELVRFYTREAGVRQLEREIGALCRHAATLFGGRRRTPWKVGVKEVEDVLGPRRFEHEVAARTALPGVATGLAWTPVGGEILFVEATHMAGKGKLTLTGQLGDVMRESAQAAVSLVRARAESLGLDPALFESHDLHLHIPAGAVPKDGPSAGVALFTALVSLLSGRRVRASVAMTGELSLRGLVLPVGGIKEKVLAAQAAGVRTVLLPARNKRDLLDVPEGALEKLDFVFLETVDDALEAALS